jgi:hypothetical protein
LICQQIKQFLVNERVCCFTNSHSNMFLFFSQWKQSERVWMMSCTIWWCVRIWRQ